MINTYYYDYNILCIINTKKSGNTKKTPNAVIYLCCKSRHPCVRVVLPEYYTNITTHKCSHLIPSNILFLGIIYFLGIINKKMI